MSSERNKKLFNITLVTVIKPLTAVLTRDTYIQTKETVEYKVSPYNVL